MTDPKDTRAAEQLERRQAFARAEDLHRFELTSHRGALARAILSVKGLLRRALHEVFARQAAFNSAAAKSIGELERDLAPFTAPGAPAPDALAATLSDLATRIDRLELYAEAAAGIKRRPSPATALELPLDEFRGDEQTITERQRPYVALFAGQSDVVDLGCGRGEFLRLLGAAGISARGLELDPGLVGRGVARGLDVRHGEAISYLQSCLPESLGGLFAAQLIEHLETDEVARLVALASTRLRPGGVLVLETVNPMTFVSLADFWVDPTHVRPIHPRLMQWIAKREGFVEIELQRSLPADNLWAPPFSGEGDIERFNAGIARINDVLFGARAYALVARRPR